jgi:hypothetical protein
MESQEIIRREGRRRSWGRRGEDICKVVSQRL